MKRFQPPKPSGATGTTLIPIKPSAAPYNPFRILSPTRILALTHLTSDDSISLLCYEKLLCDMIREFVTIV